LLFSRYVFLLIVVEDSKLAKRLRAFHSLKGGYPLNDKSLALVENQKPKPPLSFKHDVHGERQLVVRVKNRNNFNKYQIDNMSDFPYFFEDVFSEYSGLSEFQGFSSLDGSINGAVDESAPGNGSSKSAVFHAVSSGESGISSAFVASGPSSTLSVSMNASASAPTSTPITLSNALSME
jgi:hypothetical protein